MVAGPSSPDVQLVLPKDPERDRVIRFGPFRVLVRERRLLDGDRPVRLGSRALDILMALLARPGELITKRDLMRIVWPNIAVVEANLSVHVAALRRALGDGHAGARYIINSPGRGYRFVAPVTLDEASPASEPSRAQSIHNLPAQLTRLVGREEIVDGLVQRLATQRLLAIVGAGGVGKTAVALAVAERLIGAYQDGVWLVDLSPNADPRLVPTALASTLRLEIRSGDPVPALVAALKDKRMLLVLDNCEHVIDAAAALVESLLKGASAVQIVATSREPLRVEGERTYRLNGLESPPASEGISAAEVLRFPAARLFIERVTAAVDDFELRDGDAASVRDICRNLDGIPLAIELAAARVAALGVQGVAARVRDLLRLLTGGRRSAPARHQTITAVLDWSYRLLSSEEQALLRRLAVFVGGFTLEAAAAIAAGAGETVAEIADRIASLVPKSLIAASEVGGSVGFRMLEITRAYALAKLEESGEGDAIARRHAVHYRDLLSAGKNPADREGCASELDNIRAALSWAFGPTGDTSIAVALAESSAPIWLQMSLLTECPDWTGRALDVLDPADRGTRRELVLQTAFGRTLMLTQGMSERAHAALTRAVELAETVHDVDLQLRALADLVLFRLRTEDPRGALALALRGEAIARRSGDDAAISELECLVGAAYLDMGALGEALTWAERACGRATPSLRRTQIARSGLDHAIFARSIAAQTHWLQGRPDQAARTAWDLLADADVGGNPASRCLALAWTARVALWRGDLEQAGRRIARLEDQARAHGLATYYVAGLAFAGALAAARGDIAAAGRLVREGLEGLAKALSYATYMRFLCTHAEILMAAGNATAGLAAIAEAIAHMETRGASWLPEALRIHGEALLSSGKPEGDAAEAQFRRSLDIARRQGALSWELRTATSFARLLRDSGRPRDARELLAAAYARFTEGFATADLKAASQLLAELDQALAATWDVNP